MGGSPTLPGRRFWAVAVVAFCWLYVFPYHRALNNPNENSRLYLTMAIVENRSLSIDEIIARYGWVNDLAKRPTPRPSSGPGSGPPGSTVLRHYLGKAPGTSFLGVPIYYLCRKIYAVFGKIPTKAEAIYWLRLGSVILPSILFLWFLRRHLAGRVGDALADQAVIAYGLGTMATPYTLMFASHHHVAIGAFGAFLLAREAARRDRADESEARVAWPLAGSGALAGLAALSEYPLMIAVLCVGGYVLCTLKRRKLALAYAAGGAPIGLLLTLYHWRAFGRPFTTAYGHLANAAFAAEHGQGFFGLARPSLKALLASLCAPDYGLFVFAPFLLAGLLALVWFAAQPPRHLAAPASPTTNPPVSQSTAELARTDAVLGLVLLASMLAFISAMTNWRGGWTVGPRYISAVTPFLALFSALGLSRLLSSLPRSPQADLRDDLLVGTTGGLALCGLLLSGLPGLCYPHFPEVFTNPVFELLLPLLRRGYLPHHAGELFGLDSVVGILPLLAVLAVAVALASGCFESSRIRPTRMGVALLVAIVLLVPFSRVGQPSAGKTASMAFVARTWEPQPARPRPLPTPTSAAPRSP